VRIIRYDGLPELFGTLERRWVFIQWWDDSKQVSAQVLINKGVDVVNNILILKEKDSVILFLAGYRTLYKPYPTFLTTFQLKEGRWEKINLFNDSIESNDFWEITKHENTLTVEIKEKIDGFIEITQQKNGYKFYSEVNPDRKLEFRLLENQIFMK
jgi:hypothetical protein